MYSALWIADYITARGGGKLILLQIMMLTYLSHAYTLAITHKPLVDDSVEAWKYGPIYPTVFEAFKKWTDVKVGSLYFLGTLLVNKEEIKNRIKELEVFSEIEKAIINDVLESYKDWTGGELLELMHRNDTPWKRHYDGEKPMIIPDQTTKRYYERLVDEKKNKIN